MKSTAWFSSVRHYGGIPRFMTLNLLSGVFSSGFFFLFSPSVSFFFSPSHPTFSSSQLSSFGVSHEDVGVQNTVECFLEYTLFVLWKKWPAQRQPSSAAAYGSYSESLGHVCFILLCYFWYCVQHARLFDECLQDYSLKYEPIANAITWLIMATIKMGF